MTSEFYLFAFFLLPSSNAAGLLPFAFFKRRRVTLR